MKSLKGIENPAFVASSPDTPRRVLAVVAFHRDLPSSAHPGRGLAARRPASGAPGAPRAASALGNFPAPLGPARCRSMRRGPAAGAASNPGALQRCNTPGGFLFHYCLLALTQGEDGRRLRRAAGEKRGASKGSVEGRRGGGEWGRQVRRQPGEVRESARPRGWSRAPGLAKRSHRRHPTRFTLLHF